MDYEYLVIGAGPGGYVSAIRAAQLGLKVAIIEKRKNDAKKGPALGGTCLNVGCIPSKALLDSSERFHQVADGLTEHGITVTKPKLDVGKMMERKDGVVMELISGIDFLMKKNKITVIEGAGQLVDGNTVNVTAADGKESKVTAEHIVLAMGSVPIEMPFATVDGKVVITSDHAIALPKVPKHLVIIGGGVIGLELGQVWARLGAEVTVVEFLDRIAPGFDLDAVKVLQKTLEEIGITFLLQTKVTDVSVKASKATVTAEKSDGESVTLTADKVLMAVGRRPFTEGCGLEAAGVELTERGRVKTDHNLRTNLPTVSAIGDLIEGPMLAHKAEEDGYAVAELIADERQAIAHTHIPGVIYTHPEIACVGLGKDAAKEQGRKVAIGQFRFMANGRAKAAADQDGFVTVVADPDDDHRLLGATVVGPHASDLLAELTAVLAFDGTLRDIALTCHSHPTYSEAVKEAALAGLKAPLHS